VELAAQRQQHEKEPCGRSHGGDDPPGVAGCQFDSRGGGSGAVEPGWRGNGFLPCATRGCSEPASSPEFHENHPRAHFCL
jgi:hypothetical protein